MKISTLRRWVGSHVLRREVGAARRVEVDLGRVDDDVGVGELAELAYLRVGERRLRRAAATEDDDLLDPGVGELLDRVVRGIGCMQLAVGEGEHPGDVGGDVAVADHDDALRSQVELVVGEVGVGVVPGDELGGRVRAGQVLAGDPEPAIGRGAVGGDDRVIALLELGDGDVSADVNVAEELKPLAGGGLLVDADHRLDLRVVRGDPGADEPERGREPIEHVDLDRDVLAFEQVLGGVKAGRARADDRDSEWVLGCAERGHGHARVGDCMRRILG